MKWRFITFLSLFLMMAPFYIIINAEFLMFFYNILGYGLFLVSYLFKEKIEKLDILVMASLVFVVSAGLLNKFNYITAFNTFFIVFIGVYLFTILKNIFSLVLNAILLFASGFFIYYMFINNFEFFMIEFNNLEIFFTYLFYILLLSIWINSYKEIA